MIIECNLVKIQTIDARIGKLVARQRYTVQDATEAMTGIVKFINDNNATFTAALTDQKLVAQLQNLTSLTVSEFNCLRYLLSESGLDIWVNSVKLEEINPTEVTNGIFEYTVRDMNMVEAGFIPFATRFIQTQQDNSQVKLYQTIMDSYGLFKGKLFEGRINPLLNIINTMKQEEEIVGVTSKMKTTYANSLLEFLNLDIKVLTE